MSKTNKIFEKVPVKIQNYSGFDMSHYNLGTLTCGTLVPVLAEPLAPGDRISLGNLAQIDLPPLATNFYGRVDFRMEAFFVPYRILMQQWKKFCTYKNDMVQSALTSQPTEYKRIPRVIIPGTYCKAGSLADYLGLKNLDSSSLANLGCNPLPFLAYNKIYDCWYRDKMLQKPVFEEEFPWDSPTTAQNRIRRLPYVSVPMTNLDIPSSAIEPYTPDDVTSDLASLNGDASLGCSLMNDGKYFFELRQRNYHKDYFTSATYEPQAGDPAILKFDITGYLSDPEDLESAVNGKGSFTIASLRAANSLQKFIERNNLAGDDYADQIQANFGVRPSDTAINYPLYLGSTSYNVYNRSIFQTAVGVGTTVPAGETKNPFKTQGSEYGKASSNGSGSLIDNFETTEWGILMVIGSLVPHAFYATGSRKYLNAFNLGDYPIPLLASVGDQPILKGEILSGGFQGGTNLSTFGYTGRYSEYKYHDDEVHGELRDGQSLEAFAIQRSFDSSVALGTDFIQIPKDAMDQVMAADTGLSKFTAWYQIYFDLKKASQLPVYSVPTLGDEPDTHTEFIDKGGKRL